MKKVTIYHGLCILMLSSSILVLNGCSSAPKSVVEPPVQETEEKPKDVFETQQDFENENQLVEFFEKGEQKLYEIEHGETMQTVKDSLYHASITIGDFMLDGGSIGGYTWDELSDATKEKILEIANHIDDLLIKYVPEQKEWVIEKWNQLKKKTSEITKDIIGEENYEFWGNKKDEWIDKAENLYQDGKTKVKDKYQEWKNNHE